MQEIILIGGAPTTGKSTMARLLSERLGVPWVSTDQIRRVMRATVNKTEFPNIFNIEGYTAERFLSEFSSEEIVRMEIAEGEEVWRGVKTLIENGYPWEGFIVEGVAVLPHLIARDFKNNANIKPVFLVDEDADRVRDTVFTRGLWDDAKTYSDDIKEKEVAWALLFSHVLKKEIEEYGYPWVEVQKRDDDLQAVLKALQF